MPQGSGVIRDDAVPMSEPCRESDSKDRCLCTSMKAGRRSPGLYCIDVVGLEWWVVEQPRFSDRSRVVVRVEGMAWIRCVRLLSLHFVCTVSALLCCRRHETAM
jgi:hypothetical protein